MKSKTTMDDLPIFNDEGLAGFMRLMKGKDSFLKFNSN